MRIAVFTNRFPSRVCTFFARDIRGLIDAGAEIDVFPIYPLNPTFWRYVPNILNEKTLPRDRIHYLTIVQCLEVFLTLSRAKREFIWREVTPLCYAAARSGMTTFAKTTYVLMKSWAWAQQCNQQYDHVLAYWGNYSATCAYAFHRMCKMTTPFSVFFHAGIDLYRKTPRLREQLLYADNIITCSDFNRRFIFEQFPELGDGLLEKIYVHHHGLDFRQLAKCNETRSSQKVIAVGRFAKQKGFDYLLHAACELKRRGVKVNVELVGDGEEADALRALARKLNITDMVKFVGWIPADEVSQAIGSAALLVHPSPDLGDGVPNVIKEAMAVGTPVIGSRVAGIPELLDHGRCGILVAPKDAAALASAIQSMLENDEMRAQFAYTARERAEREFELWRNGKRLASRLRSTMRHASAAPHLQRI